MTNYERIKAMSAEEMAELLDDVQTDALFLEGTINDLKYPTKWGEWLNSEVKELSVKLEKYAAIGRWI